MTEKIKMFEEFSYDSELDYLTLCVSGEVTLERIRELAPKVSGILKKNNCLRFINDMSVATINVSIGQMYSSPKVMDESGITRDIKRALVVPSDFKDAVFLENLTFNKGHNLKIFKNIDNAKLWLFAE